MSLGKYQLMRSGDGRGGRRAQGVWKTAVVSVGRGDGGGDVLAQPTRARLFAHLASLNRPASTAELAAELGLHPSGVRVHLDRLQAAGLITRGREPQSLGRPRAIWSIAPDARPSGEPPGAYRQLARWLARAVPVEPGRLGELETAGREAGRELVSAGRSSSAEETIGRTFTALGFAPQREPRVGSAVRFRLGSCPFRDAVRDNQPAICALHRGLTRGLLDNVCPGGSVSAFVPGDPDAAGCLIELDGLDPVG